MKANHEESMAKMERLLADNREMKADNAESKAERKADKEKMMATIRSGQKEMIKAITGASKESTEACEGRAEMAINSVRSELEGKINARMEYAMAVADKQTQALREELNQKVEEAERRVQASIDTRTGNFQDDITSTGTEDRTGEQRLAVRRHRQRKKRAQVNGGPRQKFAAFRGRFTRRAVPALPKGHVRKGPRGNRRSGVRGPGTTSHSRIDGRSLKQRQIKGNVARETPEGRMDEKRRRTRPECNNDIRKLNKVSRTGKRGS
jgi:hypothetical protein